MNNSLECMDDAISMSADLLHVIMRLHNVNDIIEKKLWYIICKKKEQGL